MSLDVIHMSDIKVKPQAWLWEPYIPLGAVTTLLGDGGRGKSFLSLAIAASVTRGMPLPGSDCPRKYGNVILQNAENSLSAVVKPRLEMLGADCSRIVSINESETKLTLDDERIEEAIAHYNARLMIIDPLQAYLPAGGSMNSAERIRPILTKLGQIAERNACAILLVGHLNKGTGKANYRGLGSVDIFNSVPSVLYLGDVGDDARALVHGKSNLAETGPSLMFRLSKEQGFQWLGECDVTLDELLAKKSTTNASRLDEAEDFLRDLLSEGPMPASEVFAIAGDSGISEKTLKRAKKAADIVTFKKDGRWFWSLQEGQVTPLQESK